MTAPDDTIVAVSSPPGRSLRGLVRLSGPGVTTILKTIEDPRTARDESARLRLSSIRINPTPHSAGASRSVPVLIAQYAGPNSYTGQDMAEIQCPGSPALLDRLVGFLIGLGARLAEPGEFTYRAFVAGKLDLTQAEGVHATIAACSDTELRAATQLRSGRLTGSTTDLSDRLANLLALVEAGIDFSDQDDVVAITPEALAQGLAALIAELQKLRTNSRAWGAIEAIPRVVLAGAPSAGKSTLFNALLGRRRAVVDAAPGTTRDLLAEPLTIDGVGGRRVEIMLVDLAGIDTPSDTLAQQADSAAKRAIETADAVLLIDDGSRPDQLIATPPDAPVIRVRSKCDRTGTVETKAGDVSVSAVTGEGLDALRNTIFGRLADRAVSVSAGSLALMPRHESAIDAAMCSLTAADGSIGSQRTGGQLRDPELIAVALREALDHLAGIAGQISADDVIGRVFATFCIGK